MTQETNALHPRTQELLDHLEAQRATLLQAVANVPSEAHETRPSPDRWSVAEVLEHLAIVETRILGHLTPAIDAARSEGLPTDEETSSVLPTFDLERAVDRSQKRTTVTGVPTSQVDAESASKALDDTLQGLRSLLVANNGLALGTVSMPHPVFGPLNIYQWMVFIGGHEARHADQIREIGMEIAG